MPIISVNRHEPYASSALNKQFAAIVPAGFHRDFAIEDDGAGNVVVKAGSVMVLDFHGEYVSVVFDADEIIYTRPVPFNSDENRVLWFRLSLQNESLANGRIVKRFQLLHTSYATSYTPTDNAENIYFKICEYNSLTGQSNFDFSAIPDSQWSEWRMKSLDAEEVKTTRLVTGARAGFSDSYFDASIPIIAGATGVSNNYQACINTPKKIIGISLDKDELLTLIETSNHGDAGAWLSFDININIAGLRNNPANASFDVGLNTIRISMPLADWSATSTNKGADYTAKAEHIGGSKDMRVMIIQRKSEINNIHIIFPAIDSERKEQKSDAGLTWPANTSIFITNPSVQGVTAGSLNNFRFSNVTLLVGDSYSYSGITFNVKAYTLLSPAREILALREKLDLLSNNFPYQRRLVGKTFMADKLPVNIGKFFSTAAIGAFDETVTETWPLDRIGTLQICFNFLHHLFDGTTDLDDPTLGIGGNHSLDFICAIRGDTVTSNRASTDDYQFRVKVQLQDAILETVDIICLSTVTSGMHFEVTAYQRGSNPEMIVLQVSRYSAADKATAFPICYRGTVEVERFSAMATLADNSTLQSSIDGTGWLLDVNLYDAELLTDDPKPPWTTTGWRQATGSYTAP